MKFYQPPWGMLPHSRSDFTEKETKAQRGSQSPQGHRAAQPEGGGSSGCWLPGWLASPLPTWLKKTRETRGSELCQLSHPASPDTAIGMQSTVLHAGRFSTSRAKMQWEREENGKESLRVLTFEHTFWKIYPTSANAQKGSFFLRSGQRSPPFLIPEHSFSHHCRKELGW